MNNGQQALIEARKLISDESRWTQHTYAVDRDGTPVDPSLPTACKWCSNGALLRFENFGPSFDILNQAAMEIRGCSSIALNDNLGHAETMRMLDRAIELAGATT